MLHMMLEIGDHFNVMGRDWVWSEWHVQAADLQPLRQQGDDVADEIIKSKSTETKRIATSFVMAH